MHKAVVLKKSNVTWSKRTDIGEK